MGWIAEHWLVLLIGASIVGIVVRKVLVERSRSRKFEEWARERRVQREREEREEQERKEKARAANAESLCTTTEQVERAVQSRLEQITIEGGLAKSYAPGSGGLEQLGTAYTVLVARHGKVILKRAEPVA